MLDGSPFKVYVYVFGFVIILALLTDIILMT